MINITSWTGLLFDTQRSIFDQFRQTAAQNTQKTLYQYIYSGRWKDLTSKIRLNRRYCDWRPRANEISQGTLWMKIPANDVCRSGEGLVFGALRAGGHLDECTDLKCVWTPNIDRDIVKFHLRKFSRKLIFLSPSSTVMPHDIFVD